MRSGLKILHINTNSNGESPAFGPYKIATLISPEDEGALTAYRVTVEPNQVTSESYHKVAEECYFVIAGSGTAILDGKAYALNPGDFLRLPPGTKHQFRTAENALVMLDLHTPGSRPDHDVYFTGSAPDGFAEND